MNEAQFVKAAKEGNVEAFNRLVLHYQDSAFNVALRIMGDEAEAADATQAAFISAYKALNRYREEGNFKAWLLRIVNNKCLDALRKKKRHPESSIDAVIEENESPSFLSDSADLPEDLSERADLYRAIQDCLLGLPAAQRAAIVLCDVEGYDYAEIAEILVVSLGTVKSRINRGRGKLRECLRGFMELLPLKYR